jgi:hypothetical protein
MESNRHDGYPSSSHDSSRDNAATTTPWCRHWNYCRRTQGLDRPNLKAVVGINLNARWLYKQRCRVTLHAAPFRPGTRSFRVRPARRVTGRLCPTHPCASPWHVPDVVRERSVKRLDAHRHPTDDWEPEDALGTEPRAFDVQFVTSNVYGRPAPRPRA